MPVWDNDKVVALAMLARANMIAGRIVFIIFIIFIYVFLSLVDWRTLHNGIIVFSEDQCRFV